MDEMIWVFRWAGARHTGTPEYATSLRNGIAREYSPVLDTARVTRCDCGNCTTAQVERDSECAWVELTTNAGDMVELAAVEWGSK